MYEKYVHNPSSVHPSWQKLFRSLEVPAREPTTEQPKSLASETAPIIGKEHSVIYATKPESTAISDLRVFELIQAYRVHGHSLAKINPVEVEAHLVPHELKLESYGFTKQDLAKNFPTCGILPEPTASLLSIWIALKATYCSFIGIEYMYSMNPQLVAWIQKHIEPIQSQPHLRIEEKQAILQYLNKSELFESFLHTKYTGEKRFSLEGGETLIPMLGAILESSAAKGTEEFVLGMSHRGRLNVLANIFNKPYSDVFAEFEEGYIPVAFEGSGDVKYHKGFTSDYVCANGKTVKIQMASNPSHLESIDPVVEGMVKSRQVNKNDVNQERVLPILIHGDASIAGQGVVYETLQMYKLDGYTTGGTIHIVVNNQIGFTTIPRDSRSMTYCTDIAKAFSAPVFHVNVEKPEHCVFVANLAVNLRDSFHCDVFIDLVCYRKYGHNETDEPSFTQPLEYQAIRKMKSIREKYRDDLIEQGVLERYMAESLEVEFKNALQAALAITKVSIKDDHDDSKKTLPKEKEAEDLSKINTAVSKKILLEVAEKSFTVPQGFNLHPKLATLLKARLCMVKEREGESCIDWGTAETLAYGSILWDGIHVRLTGQDCCRGTFSHRHALWMDQVQAKAYIPLQNLKSMQGRFDIINSPLSEFAALAFEYGYSVAWAGALVIWEAQFGDFANGAQVVIDQYIASSERKWAVKNGVTLLLPHGYEGQGPEHSSARIERFLSLCGNNNMQVVYPTTPAQFFHLLRRQVLHTTPKPLIVFTPKSLLRNVQCTSRLQDFTTGAFKELLDDPEKLSNVKTLVLCTGKVFYDLSLHRSNAKVEDMAIVRIEQLYPFPEENLRSILQKYGKAQKVFWVQEEPANMGAWRYIESILGKILPSKIKVEYVGREVSASPAAGSHALHKLELSGILEKLFKDYELRLPKDSGGLRS
jgi:2-oxoglutarate dehydrogenase E1 component